MADNVKIGIKVDGAAESAGALKQVGEAAEQMGQKVDALKEPFNQLKDLAEAAGIAMVAEFAKSTIEAAAKSEESWTLVKSSVQNAGITFTGVKNELASAFDDLSSKSRFSEQQITEAFSTLLTVTNDYGGSMKNLGLVADIAVARHMDLNEAATLVGRVMDGNTSMLKRYGIVLQDNGVEPMDQLRARFKDFAENDAASLPGQLHQIENSFEKVKEAIGGALADGGKGGLVEFNEQLKTLGEWITDHRSDISAFAKDVAGIAEGLGKAASFIMDHGGTWVLRRMGQKKSDIAAEENNPEGFSDTFSPKIGESAETRAQIAANARMIAEQKAAEEAKKNQKEALQAIKDRIEEVKKEEEAAKKAADAVAKLVKAEKGDIDNSPLNESVKLDLNAALRSAYPDIAAQTAASNQADAKSIIGNLRLQLQDLNPTTGFRGGLNQSMKDFKDFGDAAKGADYELGQLASSTLPALTNGFGSMVEALGHGGKAFQDFGKAALNSISQVASKMASQEFATGVAMLAESIWDGFGPNPAAGASAAQHFAAAALFSAIGIGTAALGGGGGSNGGSGYNNRSLSQSQQNIQNSKGTATIVIKANRFLDTTDPDQMYALGKAIEAVSGNNIIVQYAG